MGYLSPDISSTLLQQPRYTEVPQATALLACLPPQLTVEYAHPIVVNTLLLPSFPDIISELLQVPMGTKGQKHFGTIEATSLLVNYFWLHNLSSMRLAIIGLSSP